MIRLVKTLRKLGDAVSGQGAPHSLLLVPGSLETEVMAVPVALGPGRATGALARPLPAFLPLPIYSPGDLLSVNNGLV